MSIDTKFTRSRFQMGSFLAGFILIFAIATISILTRLRSRAIANELRSIPVGLEVSHFPSPASAVKTGDAVGWRYIWPFQTMVKTAIDRPLRVEKFGMGIWHRGRWLYSREPSAIVIGPYVSPNCTMFSAADFVREFGCPGGWLVPGVEYWDEKNWAGSGRLKAFRQNWFFIARDEQGRQYRGEAIIDLDGRLERR